MARKTLNARDRVASLEASFALTLQEQEDLKSQVNMHAN
jgi:hypothetical protein